MAQTSFGVNDALTVKRWSRILFEEALKATVAFNFMGGSDSVCQVIDDLEKGVGDTLHYGLRKQLQNDPTVGSAALRGREEKMNFLEDNFLIDLVRHGVEITNRDMTRQRVPYEVRDEARMGLQDYFEALVDTWFFNQLCGYTPQTLLGWTGQNAPIAPDSAHRIFPATITADESITTVDSGGAGGSKNSLFTLAMIDSAILKAKTLSPAIRPIKVGNKRMYVCFMHPQHAVDLRTNTSTGQWLDIQKAAMTGDGSAGNPIFTDALGVYHNTVLIEDSRVTNGVNSGAATTSVATVRRAVFCGAQAAVMGYGREKAARGDRKAPPIFWREQMDDYEQSLGVSANMIAGMKKSVFGSTDNAVITISAYSAS